MKSYYEENTVRIQAEERYRKKNNKHPILNDKYFRIGTMCISVFATCILIYYLIFHASSLLENINYFLKVLRPVFVGLVIAYLLTPLLNFIECRLIIPLFDKWHIRPSEKRERMIRGICILITTLLAVVCAYAMIYLLISEISPSIIKIYSNFDEYTASITGSVAKLLNKNPEMGRFFSDQINNFSEDLENWFVEKRNSITMEQIKVLSLTAMSFLKGVWNFVIGFIISIYVLASKEKFAARSKKIVYTIWSRKTGNAILDGLRFTHQTFIGFIEGKVLDSLIIGLICFIVTNLMQTPYGALVSLIIGVTNVIPFFGPYIGAIPTTILVFVDNPMEPMHAVYFLIFILILQQVDGNIIGPKILGDSTGLAGFWVIFSITLFGGFFGIAGMIIGVPVFAVFYAAMRRWVNSTLQKKQLPYRTDDYVDFGAFNDDGSIQRYVVKSRDMSQKKKAKDYFPTFISWFYNRKKQKGAEESKKN